MKTHGPGGVSPADALAATVADGLAARERRQRAGPSARKRRGRRAWLRRAAVGLGLAAATFAGAAGALAWRLSQGALSLDVLTPQLTATIASAFGAGTRVEARGTVLERDADGLSLRIADVSIRDPGGALVLSVPRAAFGFDLGAVLTGRLEPRRIAFLGPTVRLIRDANGLRLVGAEAAAAPPEGAGGGDGDAAATAGALAMLATPGAPMAGVAQLSVRRGRVVVDDRVRARTVAVDEVGFDLAEVGARRSFEATGRGAFGRWSIVGDVAAIDAGVALTASATGFAVADLAPFVDDELSAVAGEVPLAGQARVSLSRDGQPIDVEGSLRAGTGTIRLDDPDAQPFQLDGAELKVSRRGSGAVRIERLRARAGLHELALTGELGPEAEGRRLLRLTGGGRVAPALAGAPPVAVSELALDGALASDRLVVERLRVRGAELEAGAAGAITAVGGRLGFELTYDAANTSVPALLALWPHFVAAPVRQYLVENALGGTVERMTLATSLSPETLAAAKRREPVPDESVTLDLKVRNGRLKSLPGLPTLDGLEVSGRVTGRTALLRVPRATMAVGPGRAIALSDGTFRVEDTAAKPASGELSFQAQGGVDAMLDVLTRDALKSMAKLTFDPATVRGQADLAIGLVIPLSPGASLAATGATAKGQLTNLTVDRAFGKERIENANLALAFDAKGLTLRGDARLAGAPAQVSMVQPSTGFGSAEVSLVLDDALRARRGFNAGPQLSGPIPARIAFDFDPKDDGPEVELDLSRAAINGLLPGWTKPAGRPGKLQFTLRAKPNGASTLDDLRLDAGPTVLRGAVDLAADGSPTGARFTSFRLSPGDEARLDWERGAGGGKIQIRGNTLDVRPFVRVLTGAAGATGAAATPAASPATRDADLDVKVAILTGFNSEAITNADLRLVLANGAPRQFSLNGRIGRAPVEGRLGRGAAGPVLNLETADAGGFLRFVDLYRRMTGGALELEVAVKDGEQDGLLVIRGFRVRDEPALGQITSRAAPGAGGQGDGADRFAQAAARIDANDVPFEKLRVDFLRGPTRLALREAVAWGPQVGASVDGVVDFGRDRLDLKGTFVPAYGLNNVFAQLPLVGPLLGGGQYEGLFAINFRIAGRVSAPVLQVNPLSAIAPGFLRRLFDFRSEPAEPTPARPSGAGARSAVERPDQAAR